MKKIVKLLMKESTSISSFFKSMIVVLFGIINDYNICRLRWQ